MSSVDETIDSKIERIESLIEKKTSSLRESSVSVCGMQQRKQFSLNSIKSDETPLVGRSFNKIEEEDAKPEFDLNLVNKHEGLKKEVSTKSSMTFDF